MSEHSESRLQKPDVAVKRRQVLQGSAVMAASAAVLPSAALAQAGRAEIPKGPVTVNVSNAAMKVTKEGVVVSDSTLTSLLRTDRDGTVNLLKGAVPGLQTSEVSLDSAGRVLINNKTFTGKVEAAKIGDLNLCHLNWKCSNQDKK